MRDRYLVAWCACTLALGIWLADAAAVPLRAAALTGLVCAAAAAVLLRTGRTLAAWGLCLLFVCAAGMVRMDLEQHAWEGQSLHLTGAEGNFSGVIAGEGLCRPGPDGTVRYPVEAQSVQYADGRVYPVKGMLYLYVPWDGASEPLPPDTAVQAEGQLSSFRFYDNPGKMDLESRYQSRRLIGRIYTESAEDVQARGRAGAYPLEAAAAQIRSGLRETFAPYMDPARLSVLMTLLFGGQYHELPEGLPDQFAATGIIHILSVSGSHVALLFGFLCLAGRWLRLPERVMLPLAAVVILGYAALAGFVPPVIRASIMGVLSVAGLFFHRDRAALLSLGVAVLGMLLWDPLYLFDVSFQLSVGASAGILLFYRPLLGLLEQVPRLPRWIGEGAAMALSAQLLTVPVVLFDFHRLPVYFLPANLVVTPLLEWSIILGLLAALASVVFLPLAAGLVQCADYLLWAGLRLNEWLAALPGASLSAGGMAPAETALYYGTVCLCRTQSWWNREWHRRAAAGVLAGLLLAGCALSKARQPALTFFVPDLGVSRAAVLTDGAYTLVYYRDGGLPFDMGERELTPVLEYKGIDQADILICDLRQCRGASAFTLALPVGEIWLPEGTEDEAAALLAAHPGSRVRFLGEARLSLSTGLTAVTDGTDWYLEKGDCGWYLDGGGAPLQGITPAAHCIWMGGAESFRPAVNHDTMKWLAPEAAVYAGNRTTQAGEDRDYFLLCGIPVGDPFLDGMVDLFWDGSTWTMEKYHPSGLTESLFARK